MGLNVLMAGVLEAFVIRNGDPLASGTIVPQARVVHLVDDFHLIPLTARVKTALGGVDAPRLGFLSLTSAMIGVAEDLSRLGEVAYCHLEFHAGTGFQAAVVWVDPRLGLILHSIILLVLMAEAAFDREAKFGRFCLALTLLPLMRIVSLAVPLYRFHPLAWQLLVAAPLFLAIFVIISYLSLRREQIGLRFELGPFGLMFIGLPLGLAVY